MAEETVVTEEMKEAAEADLKEKAEATKGIRTFRRGERAAQLRVRDLYDFPVEFDLEGIAPTSYLAQPEGEITGSIDTQKFSIREERLKGLVFDKPARRLEGGRPLRMVKAIGPSGTLVQLPFEPQVNNTAAGDLQDAIGLKKYQRKGFIILFDFDKMQSVYCMARNCWAAAMVEPLAREYPQHADMLGSGYCSYDHYEFTEPNSARRGKQGGMFSVGATTSTTFGHKPEDR